MASARVIVDSEDDEQDMDLSPHRQTAVPSVHISGVAPSTGSTESREALGRKIQDAHIALMESTPKEKGNAVVDLTSPTVLPAGQRTSAGQATTNHDIFTFPASSASEFSPIQTKRIRAKTMLASAQIKDRNPQRSKSMGRATNPADADEDSDTWEPTNPSKLLGEPVGIRKTRRMGDNDITEGLPKPKRPRRSDPSRPAKVSEIKIDLTDETVVLSESQKKEYERISPPSSSLPDHQLPHAPAVPANSSEHLADESSTVPFSSTPQALKIVLSQPSSEHCKNAGQPPTLGSTPTVKAPKTYSKLQRAKTTVGLGRENHNQDMSDDELSLRRKEKRRRVMVSEELAFDSKSKAKVAKSSRRKIYEGAHGPSVEEDDLGLDDIGLVKEYYKPRPSRSRSNRASDKHEEITIATEDMIARAPTLSSKPDHANTKLDGESDVKSANNGSHQVEGGSDLGFDLGDMAASKSKRRKGAIVEDKYLSDWDRSESEGRSTKAKSKKLRKAERNTTTIMTDSAYCERLPAEQGTEGEPREDQQNRAGQVLSTIENSRLPKATVSTGDQDEASSVVEKDPLLEREVTPFQKPALQPEITKTPVHMDNIQKRQHSPLNSGKVPYRVGLSKRCRIEPLLRIVRK